MESSTKAEQTAGGDHPRNRHGQEESNQINVSTKRNPNFYVFLGKKHLEESETIELHAIGNAVSISVIAAENLVRNKYATFKEIKTKTITVSGNRGDSKKAKLFITLERSPEFFDNMKKFNEIKEENDKKAQTLEGETKQ